MIKNIKNFANNKGENSAKMKFFGIVIKKFSVQFSSGFTLLEVIIYLAIFSMIAATLISLAYVSAMENRKTTSDVVNAYENI